MTEMTNVVGVLVGGIGKALLAGGREGAAVPGHQHRAFRAPQWLDVAPLRSQVFLRLSYLYCILINQ